ncbi:hypothetical protein NQ318_007662 [Aromia moschata]|uniref:Mos1 transposase HTH domain-containing protein n=1 Tax=Aromia moschata TaxID=1265417 RepID=A0AAV8XLT8_9CUCU|nr:hypothetical protein NQ318_007662 [Aromia moschata]
MSVLLTLARSEPLSRCLVTLPDEPFIRAALLGKFCFKLGKIASETHEMINSAYGDDAMGRSSVFEWRKSFREGREKVEDNQRSARASTIKNDESMVKVKNLLKCRIRPAFADSWSPHHDNAPIHTVFAIMD